MKPNKLFIFVMTLAVCAGVFFCFQPSPAYASESGALAVPEVVSVAETLSVDAVWLEGDMLHITVTDTNTGLTQTLELKLSDYANSGDELVSVQAVDSAGNKSNMIQFKNPYYVPAAASGNEPEAEPADGGSPDDAASADGLNPFTHDGTGTVVDNAGDSDGKEFFSIETENGDVFYLIVDRHRSTENVYLLNPVNEQDLASLAVGGGANPSPTPAPTPEPTPTQSPEPEEPPAKTAFGGIDSGALIFIVIAALIAGGLGYYFKVIKPRKDAGSSDDYDEPDDVDDSEIYGGTDGGDEE